MKNKIQKHKTTSLLSFILFFIILNCGGGNTNSGDGGIFDTENQDNEALNDANNQDNENNSDDTEKIDEYDPQNCNDPDNDGYGTGTCLGTDCDENCPSCHPEAEQLCDSTFDHDCDGIIDIWEQCSSCVSFNSVQFSSEIVLNQVQIKRVYQTPNNLILIAGHDTNPTEKYFFWIVDPLDGQIKGKIYDPELRYDLTITGSAIDVYNNMAYVGSDRKLFFINISDPRLPEILGAVSTSDIGEQTEVKATGDYELIVSTKSALIKIYDISNPQMPQIVNSKDWFPGNAKGLFRSNKTVYVTGTSGNIEALYPFDITNARTPKSLEYIVLKSSRRITGDHDSIYVAGSNDTCEGIIKYDQNLNALNCYASSEQIISLWLYDKILIASSSGQLLIYDLETTQIINQTTIEQCTITDLFIFNSRITIGCDEGTVLIYNLSCS